MELTGKTYLLLEALAGLAKQLRWLFAKEGANIVLNGRSEITPEQRKEIEAFGVKMYWPFWRYFRFLMQQVR